MQKFILTLVVAAIGIAVVCTAQDTCGPNQVFNDCGTACPDYCHRGNFLQICTLQCVVGCECAPGYIKKYIDSNECVPTRACTRAVRCGRNKAFHTCGSACPKYCGQPEDVPCTRNCVAECQCRPGYVLRSKTSSDCIPAGACPS